MPKKPIKAKDDLDRFYTKDSVALQCIEHLKSFVPQDSLFIEPSAGGGAFYRQLPENKIGYDLAPTCDGVLESSWFDVSVPEGSVIIGNPPFGTRNALTKAFIKHSLNAHTIAFVLPKSYKKVTTQSVFPPEWKLSFEWELPEYSFLLAGEDYHVPCVFQIWQKESLTDMRESSKIQIKTEDFTFVSKQEGDWFCFGASPSKIVEKRLVTENNRGYYVKEVKQGVKERFLEIPWKQYANSSVSGGVAWFSKQEIINSYEDFKNGNRN